MSGMNSHSVNDRGADPARDRRLVVAAVGGWMFGLTCCGCGSVVSVAIDFASTEDRSHIRVPPVALAEDRAGRYLWVVEPASDGLSVVRRRPVELGELTSEGVDVVSGLRVGDDVVTAGVSRIRDGQQVRIVEDLP